MADHSVALPETLRRTAAEGDPDVLRLGVRVLAQAIMAAEVSDLTRAAAGTPRGRP